MSDERYEITQLIGKGRTGGVYEAEDHVLKRKVAMRRFFSQTGAAGANDYQSEFEAITHNLGAIQHPSLLTVYDAGLDGDGPFMIAQLLGGQSLTEKITEASSLQPQEAHEFAHQMLDALTAAHAAGFYHGAITPGSIMLKPRARGGHHYVILDLGLSRLAPLIQGENSTLAMMADPATIPPELFAGQPASAKSDLYMLGHLIYYSLLGGHPFAGLSLEDAATWHQTGIPHLSTVNPIFQGPFYDWIATLTHPDPASRPESAVAAMQSQPPAPQNHLQQEAVPPTIATQEVSDPPPPTIATREVAQPPTAQPPTQHYTTAQPSLHSGAQQVTTHLPAAEDTPKKSKNKMILIGAAALGLITLALIFILGGKSEPEDQAPDNLTENTNKESSAPLVEETVQQQKAPKVFKNVASFHLGKNAHEKGVLRENEFLGIRPQARMQYRNDLIAFNHGQYFLAPGEEAAKLINPDRIALSTYVYIDELKEKNPLVSYYSDTTNPAQGFHISVEKDQYVLVFTTGRENYRIESPGAQAKTWTQVAFTYSSGNLKFFVDGKRVGQAPTLLAPLKTNKNSDFLLGAIQYRKELTTMSGVIRYLNISPNPSHEQIEAWWEQALKANLVQAASIPKPFPIIPSIDIGTITIDP